MLPYITNIDFAILNFIQDNIRNTPCDYFFKYITMLANSGGIWVITGIVFLFMKKYRKTGITMAVGMAISLILFVALLKPIVGRPRPYELVKGFTLLISPPPGASFPSGHTLVSCFGATVIAHNHKNLKLIAIVLAILISFSRLYLYVHFPTDVCTGAILGVLSGFVSVYAADKCKKRTE